LPTLDSSRQIQTSYRNHGKAGVSVDEYKEYEKGTQIFTIEENLKAFNRQ